MCGKHSKKTKNWEGKKKIFHTTGLTLKGVRAEMEKRKYGEKRSEAGNADLVKTHLVRNQPDLSSGRPP